VLRISIMSSALQMSVEEKNAVFKRSWLFETANAETKKQLSKIATARIFRKREIVFQEDDPSRYFYLISEGMVKSFKQSASGKILVLSVGCPGDTLNTVVLFSGNPYFLSAQAMIETVLLRISALDYVSVTTKDQQYMLRQVMLQEQVVRSACDRLIDIVGSRAEQRISNILYMLRAKLGSELKFTADEIADLSGITTETVIRVFGELKKQNIISLSRSNIHIVNDGELKELSRGLIHAPGRI
jgi:CRP/FNR family transcriptional regulator, cyclic AMP receptor protein